MKEMEHGEVYLAFVRFAEDVNRENPRGKNRPVVILEDKEENKKYFCKVSSKIDKPLERKNGYVLKDWQEAGLDKPSIVALNKENVREIDDKVKIVKFIGNLTERDIIGMAIKSVRMSVQEKQKDLNLER